MFCSSASQCSFHSNRNRTELPIEDYHLWLDFTSLVRELHRRSWSEGELGGLKERIDDFLCQARLLLGDYIRLGPNIEALRHVPLWISVLGPMWSVLHLVPFLLTARRLQNTDIFENVNFILRNTAQQLNIRTGLAFPLRLLSAVRVYSF